MRTKLWMTLMKIFLVLLGIVGVAAGISQLDTPSPRSASPESSDFSAEIALTHLKVIAREPHPTGSLAIKQVRDYLVSELKEQGLEVDVQKELVFDTILGTKLVQATYVENVIGRLPGLSKGNGIALVAHYDSVYSSPGAIDDGAGVASILETLRAINAGNPLERDLYVIFTDGEEWGTLGAKAFIEKHPWAKNIDFAVNIDATGMRGPSTMNDISYPGGWITRWVLKYAPYPFANSFGLEAGRQLLGDRTDFVHFRKAGIPGISYSTILDVMPYHTMADNPDNVDLSSLQHKGEILLNLSRQFGNLDSQNNSQDEMVFFLLLPGIVIHYSSFWVLPIVALVTAGFILLFSLSIKRKTLQIGKFLLSLIFILVSLMIAIAVGELSWRILASFVPDFQTYATAFRGVINNGTWVLVGLAFLIVTVLFTLFTGFGRRLGKNNIYIATCFIWLLISILVSVMLPGASYAFVLPLLFNLPVLAWILLGDPELPTWRGFLVLCAGMLTTLILLTPVVYPFFLVFNFGGLGFPGVLLWGFLIALVVGLLLPQMDFLSKGKEISWAVGLFSVGILAILIGVTCFPSFDAQHPRQVHLLYILDIDEQEAQWIGGDRELDPWTSQVLEDPVVKAPLFIFEAAGVTVPSFQAQAPLLDLPVPELIVLQDISKGVNRELSLHVRSPRKSEDILVKISTQGLILNASLNGQAIDLSQIKGRSEGTLWVGFGAVPEEGFELGLEIDAGKTIEIVLDDRSPYYPEMLDTIIPPRPDNLVMAAAGTIDNPDGSRVVKTYILQP